MAKRTIGKGRSSATVTNKTRQIKNTYRKLFENSKKNKERNEKNGYKTKKEYFCDKYPTEKSYLEKIEIKQASKKATSSVRSSI